MRAFIAYADFMGVFVYLIGILLSYILYILVLPNVYILYTVYYVWKQLTMLILSSYSERYSLTSYDKLLYDDANELVRVQVVWLYNIIKL